MEQDLDELLEEVETKFIKDTNNYDNVNKFKVKKVTPNSSFSDDTLPLDDIIPDVKNDDTALSVVSLRQVSGVNTPSKCFPVYLGGTDISTGLSTIGSQRACNNLHCITCDFAVSAFDHFQWIEGTDYLFLRTNMPEFERVKFCLQQASGWRAYACQCQHLSTRQQQALQSLPSLTWICRSH